MFVTLIGTLNPQELSSVATGTADWIAAELGPVDGRVLEDLRTFGLDQAPVYSAGRDRLLGVVSLERLQDLFHAQLPLEATEPELNDPDVFLVATPFVTCVALFQALAARRALIVMDYSPSGTIAGPLKPEGLLTLSDLNRHIIRGSIYSIFAELESRLAREIDREFEEPWHWIQMLGEDHQVRILGSWDLTRRRGVDVGPTTAATLAQLLQVSARCRPLLDRLGYPSRKAFEDATGSLALLRNSVMHPVRPLVLGSADVTRAHRSLTHAIDLHERLEKVSLTRRGAA